MKYLVLFAVLLIAYMVWRNNRLERPGPGARSGAAPRGTPPKPLEMVSCATCGLHLPQPEAVAGSNGLYYCSHEHRQRAGR